MMKAKCLIYVRDTGQPSHYHRSNYGVAQSGGVALPLVPGTKAVDRAPHLANPTICDVVDKRVDRMKRDGIIEQRATPWGAAVIIEAKRDDSPLLCQLQIHAEYVFCRNHGTYMSLESHVDIVAGAKFISILPYGACSIRCLWQKRRRRKKDRCDEKLQMSFQPPAVWLGIFFPLHFSPNDGS